MKVWILMYIDNEYNQPEKAFEALFWEKPTLKDLEKYGFKEEHMKKMAVDHYGGTTYWIEEFEKPKK